MKRKEILALDDSQLDKVVKIQGTDYDRKRRISLKTVEKMARMHKRGKSYAEIAAKFSCSYMTARYNLDEEFRKAFNARRNGAHTGMCNMPFEDRVNYKRKLIADKAKGVIIVDD